MPLDKQMKDQAFIIAEVGQAHDGSLGMLHSYIDALAPTGVNAIKFQTHIAEAESSTAEPFRVHFSYEDGSRFDYWKRMSFTEAEWIGIKNHCNEVGIEFLSSPFSIAAVNLLEKLGVPKYKVGSGEIRNYLLLDKIAKTRKPVILSSGLGSFAEIDRALGFLPANEVAILQCTTAYPTDAKNIGLNVIQELIMKYPEHTIGFSDHSGRIETCLAARVLGAKMLEFHVVFDRRMFGPDAKASLTIDEIQTLTSGIRFIEDCLAHPVDKTSVAAESDLVKMFGKSLAVNRDMIVGSVLSLDDLEAKKPAGQGIPASDYSKVIGKALVVRKEKYDFLQEEDLSP